MVGLTLFVSCKKNDESNSIVGKWEATHTVEWDTENGQKVLGTDRTFNPEPGDVFITEFKASGDITSYLNGRTQMAAYYEVSKNGETLTLYSEEGMVSRTITIHAPTQLVLEGVTFYDDPQDTGSYWVEEHLKRID